MHKILLRIFFLVTGTMTAVLVQAQDSLNQEKPQMAELMRSNGKIYVVVVVLLIILIGLFFYLIRLDRKLGRIEKSNK